jgi:hypothetical protein
MGPEMKAVAEVLNGYFGAWIAIGVLVLGGAILIALAVDVLRALALRLRDGGWGARVSRAFAQAVANRDPQAAELMANLDLAANVRHAGRTAVRVR